MIYLLNWRLWVFGILLALGPIGYLKGCSDGKHKAQAEYAASVAASNAEARRLENARESMAASAVRDSVSRQAGLRTDLARTGDQLNGMRSTLDATERRAKESAEAAARLVSTYRAVFESCTAEYRAMGAEAAGHASDSLMYQEGWPK